mmetsp:Transcript_36493/g.53501  ORF Transcript_36493/g.53501 Transcript_36493/m.53501 type:complete len:102 (+) Transcript_36493:149-454(+)|eukprot:CAMPEP_0195511262 /NCGR_PEP_ID=MMETSP0794_2-20130614/3649_1 /TAXON_ID=515487 /ORGANISM="Stephanopyxis turris, Strain CCMP 815" /LENGTH=101 /DNA_ID=CAMNT_0040638827 /DNA_START=149 /DNA_END=454 /DNA_ORIENTATION=+
MNGGEVVINAKTFANPRIKKADMNAEVTTEAIEIITMQVDKSLQEKTFETAARNIKKLMDKKFGPHWHCIIGENFGMDVTHQKKNLILLYYMQMGILLFKC